MSWWWVAAAFVAVLAMLVTRVVRAGIDIELKEKQSARQAISFLLLLISCLWSAALACAVLGAMEYYGK